MLCKSCHIFTSTRNYRIHKCWTILYLTLTRLWFSKGVQWIRLGRVMDSPCSIIFAVLALCLSLPTTSADSKFGKLTVVHGQYIAICIYIKKHTYLPRCCSSKDRLLNHHMVWKWALEKASVNVLLSMTNVFLMFCLLLKKGKS